MWVSKKEYDELVNNSFKVPELKRKICDLEEAKERNLPARKYEIHLNPVGTAQKGGIFEIIADSYKRDEYMSYSNIAWWTFDYKGEQVARIRLEDVKLIFITDKE